MHEQLLSKFNAKTFRYKTEERDKINAASIFADNYHGDQKRKSKEPYIVHPLAVAEILIKYNMDVDTICAGLLHDLLEDTDCTYDEIKDIFGQVVADLVDGVTKISQLKAESKSTQEAESIRKMFFAMSKDMRVVLIKLADKLHNMQTLMYLKPVRQKEFAQDCLDIFAPMAGSLGISSLRADLEDLSLKVLKPDTYHYIKDFLLAKKSEHDTYIKNIQRTLLTNFFNNGIKNVQVKGRVKHIYSIYMKIKKRKKEIDEIFDVFGVRVICNSVTECYSILGIIHQTWPPIEGRFKDYIAMPKANNYQSLHTTILGPNSRHLEIQIRTDEMDQTAEEGVASHWSYKASTNSSSKDWKSFDQANYNKIINKIKNWSKEIEANADYMDEIKNDLLKDTITVFTPQGKVIELPVGSTALDFAYRVHSEVGNHTAGAKADGSIIPLGKPLSNTQVVEILTSNNASPKHAWIEMAKTNSARKKIIAWINKHQVAPPEKKREEEKIDEIIKTKPDLDFNKGVKFTPDVTNSGSGIVISEEKNVLFDYAKCCNPIYGDKIVAYITRGRGYVIHREKCHNLENMSEVESRLVPVEWDNKEKFRRFRLLTKENSQIFGEIDSVVKRYQGKLLEGSLNMTPEGLFGTFTVSASDDDNLKKIFAGIKQIPSIIKIDGMGEERA